MRRILFPMIFIAIGCWATSCVEEPDAEVCGDTVCELEETCATCPDDCGTCPPECGDGTCIQVVFVCNGNPDCPAGEDEDHGTCGSFCGDGVCALDSGEDPATCAEDCACGDDVCDPGLGEDPATTGATGIPTAPWVRTSRRSSAEVAAATTTATRPLVRRPSPVPWTAAAWLAATGCVRQTWERTSCLAIRAAGTGSAGQPGHGLSRLPARLAAQPQVHRHPR